MDIINISNLKKVYNKVTVVDIPLLKICKGEVVGVVGNNGAGKTTMLRLILDLIKADSGNVYLRGIDVSKNEKWKTYTSSYLDTNFLIDFLTPEEYFMFIADCYGIDLTVCKRKISEFNGFMNDEVLDQKKYIREFSSGNRQKIGIIGSVLPNPDILILDEPFNFLDPTSQFFIKDYFSSLNKNNGTTMVISSHNLECIYDIATRLVVLEKGKIIKHYATVDINVKEELSSYFRLN